MALNLSLDLNNSTFADLAALVEAARTAGIPADAQLVVDGEKLSVTSAGHPSHARAPRPAGPERPVPPVGSDAALKFIAELLGGADRGGRA